MWYIREVTRLSSWTCLMFFLFLCGSSLGEKGLETFLWRAEGNDPLLTEGQWLSSYFFKRHIFFQLILSCLFHVSAWLSQRSVSERGHGGSPSLPGWAGSRLHQEAACVPPADSRLEGFSFPGFVSHIICSASWCVSLCKKEGFFLFYKEIDSHKWSVWLFSLSDPKQRCTHGSAASTWFPLYTRLLRSPPLSALRGGSSGRSFLHQSLCTLWYAFQSFMTNYKLPCNNFGFKMYYILLIDWLHFWIFSTLYCSRLSNYDYHICNKLGNCKNIIFSQFY